MGISPKEKIQMLRKVIAKGSVLVDPNELLTYESDAGLEGGIPDGVVFPQTTADVAQFVAWANQNHIPLVARGAGTGTTGGAVAHQGGLIVEFSHMNRILELDEEERIAFVEPGVVNFALDELARTKGMCFPPDPASGRVCTIGGNVAENAGGPHCFKYGVVTNYVLGLKVVLADGSVVQLGGRGIDEPGYDLIGVLTGSEGTLGIVTEISLHLIRNPPATALLMAAFGSIEEAGEAVSGIIGRGLTPATIEMMDQMILQIVEDYSHIGLPVDAAAVLIIEVDGYESSLSKQTEEIIAVLGDYHTSNITLARNEEEREKIRRARKDSAGALARLAPAYYASDCTVPRSKIAPAIQAITRACNERGLQVCYLLHAGDGNLHPNILVQDSSDHELMERVKAAEADGLKYCVEQGGSIRGEHGVGIEGRALMPLMYNVDELQAMQDIKAIFDPKELINPGKIFPSVPSALSPLNSVSMQPVFFAAPSSVQEAAQAVLSCISGDPPRSLAIRGGSTKYNLAPSTDCTISTKKLVGIRVFAPDDLYVTVGAGTTLAGLQAELKPDRMWVPLMSPWAESTLGGIVSTNFNAPLRMRFGYGGIRDLVLAVTVILPNGHVIRVGRPVVKNVAGYDMPKLFVGAYGTLGLITDVTLKVTTLPRTRISLVIPVDCVEHGISLGKNLKRICLVASALILCKGSEIPGLRSSLGMVYTAEGIEEDVIAELAEVRKVLRANGIKGETLVDALSGSAIWTNWLGLASLDSTTLRVGAPSKNLPDLLRKLSAELDSATFVVDLGNSLLYLNGQLGPNEIATIRESAHNANGYAFVLRSTTNNCDEWGYPPEGINLMKALKKRWDHQGLLNPGVFVV